MGSRASANPVTRRISRARGPPESTARPWEPTAVHASSDQGLPERSGSRGCEVPGKTTRLSSSAWRETRLSRRRTSTRSLATPRAPKSSPADNGQLSHSGSTRVMRPLSRVTPWRTPSPTSRRPP